MESYLENLTESEFENHKEALAAHRLEKPKQMSTQSVVYWAEITSQQYNFDRANIEVAHLRTLTKQDVIKFYKVIAAMVEESRTFEEAASSQTSRRPFEEELLHAARNGDVSRVQEILTIARQGEEVVDINCKGKSKSNLGWTPLHLASYFGHREVVQLLLDHDVDINAVNDVGDTALHKAAFIGREDLVILLLGRNADVNIRNGEGRTARDVGVEDGDTKRLLEAAEKTDSRRKEEALLSAARNGDLVQISNLLKSERPPNINCVDSLGNTALHCASYRGHKEAAVSLLQNGIDSTIKNIRGQTALMLARDAHMSQVLCVRPVRQVQRTVTRFESMLLKRSRFLGWKPTWAVLERGVLTYFQSRADASSGLSVSISAEDPSGEIGRQKWLSALAEHIAFNTHYITQGKAVDDSDDEDDDIKPLGSMQDSLQTATAKYQLLETRLQEIGTLMETSSIDSGCVQNSSLKRFEELYDTASSMLSSLAHCLILIKQQEEVGFPYGRLLTFN
ncbi:hypothetical protein GE061_016112 [Apolygus lucorum]|uniref:Uncharacterized protein n=1 Tax=Apolygus lucorum TaxID=248454 RepID=A0A8S9XJA1_APOLU|nr:hypothetical protein GE061_016112 [Apolygus lucorum]